MLAWLQGEGRALPMPGGTVMTMGTDASSEKGRGATLGDRFSRGTWTPEAQREGANWKEFRAVGRPPDPWSDLVEDKLVLVRMDDSRAAPCANADEVSPGRQSSGSRLFMHRGGVPFRRKAQFRGRCTSVAKVSVVATYVRSFGGGREINAATWIWTSPNGFGQRFGRRRVVSRIRTPAQQRARR